MVVVKASFIMVSVFNKEDLQRWYGIIHDFHDIGHASFQKISLFYYFFSAETIVSSSDLSSFIINFISERCFFRVLLIVSRVICFSFICCLSHVSIACSWSSFSRIAGRFPTDILYFLSSAIMEVVRSLIVAMNSWWRLIISIAFLALWWSLGRLSLGGDWRSTYCCFVLCFCGSIILVVWEGDACSRYIAATSTCTKLQILASILTNKMCFIVIIGRKYKYYCSSSNSREASSSKNATNVSISSRVVVIDSVSIAVFWEDAWFVEAIALTCGLLMVLLFPDSCAMMVVLLLLFSGGVVAKIPKRRTQPTTKLALT